MEINTRIKIALKSNKIFFMYMLYYRLVFTYPGMSDKLVNFHSVSSTILRVCDQAFGF